MNSVSSSLGHNSAERSGAVLLDQSGAAPNLPFKLSGSQKKTAYALRKNCEDMIAEAGVNSVVFVTFTLGERDQWGEWSKVYDAEDASRRINNLSRHILAELFEKFILVTERHKDGGIHFHALAVVRGRPDIRTGFDFEDVADGDYGSASDALRAVWEELRAQGVADLGFGRCETLPIKKCGEAVAAYVSKYIEKNICHRLHADKGKKLVRYHGFRGRHLKPNDFGWATPKACEWRRKVMAIASTARVWTPEAMRKEIGPRWAWRATQAMFDLRLEDWRRQGEEQWREDQMPREQIALAAEFMRRDAQSWEEARGRTDPTLRMHPNIWDRPLTEAEAALLAEDMENYRADQLARGMDFNL